MTETEERRRFDYDHTGRTPQDYAIEHAGYMAQAARHLIECVNKEADARGAWEDAEDDGEQELREQTLDAAVEDTSEALRTLTNRVYEFEKRRDRALGVPEAQPQQEKNMELPDAIRVPLDELEADAAYIIGRVAADGSCSGIMVEAIRKRTRAIREALLAHGAQGSARDHNEVMALVYLYGSHCAEHPEDAAGQQERLAGVKTALGVALPDGAKNG